MALKEIFAIAERNLNHDEQELLAEARELLTEPATTEDELICECMCISLQQIREHLRGSEPSLDKLKELKLGGGCSSCLNNFKHWKHKI